MGKKTQCLICLKYISNNNINKHILSCKGSNKTSNLDNLKLLENGKYECSHCGKEYHKNGIRIHIWKKHGDGKTHNPNAGYLNGSREIWNKGLTKETNESVAKSSLTLKSKYASGEITQSSKGKKRSPETLIKLSASCGGYRKGAGRGKKGWYKDYWCDSSYELAFVIYNLDHNIQFVRNNEGFEYQFNNKSFKYYPDFILQDSSYVEIKGYMTLKDKAKLNNFPHNIKIMYGENLKYVFDYVFSKYGKDFIELYEDKTYSKTRTQQEFFLDLKEINSKKRQDKINSILNSNIDFSNFGWATKTSKIINISPNKVTLWMKSYMYDFWEEKCFKRKGTKVKDEK